MSGEEESTEEEDEEDSSGPDEEERPIPTIRRPTQPKRIPQLPSRAYSQQQTNQGDGNLYWVSFEDGANNSLDARYERWQQYYRSNENVGNEDAG